MNTGDYIAASNLILYVLGAGVVYALKIIFATIKESHKQSIVDDDRLEAKIDKLDEKIDSNENTRRGADLDQYRLIGATQVKVAHLEGYKDGYTEGKAK